MNIAKNIELLLNYAKTHGLITEDDVVFSRNLLLDLLKIPQPFEGDSGVEACDFEAIITPLLKHAHEIGLIEEPTETRFDLFEGRIMGLLTPRPSEVIAKFNSFSNTSAATEYFFNLSRATNYIKTERVKKNLQWTHKTDFGELQITINLSKPEKDPRDIAKAIAAENTGYPKCLLCADNEGFAGHLNHPARQNHRIIPITLGGEAWYFQYSPYAYYNEHCIPLCAEHRAIDIGVGTFERLLDFLEIFPHYFVGSNAGLPIAGGSILNHDHFQGGRHTFPVEKAEILQEYSLLGVSAAIIKWPMSIIRLRANDRAAIIRAAAEIFAKWQSYEDKSAEIIPFSGNTPHNTITPIARINPAGEYELDITLRNNRTSPKFPDGIFHPHPHVHHIKKENIGLIEVMGLAILPGRLADELLKAEDRQAKEAYIGDVFLEVLSHAGVFKYDDAGIAAFKRFIKTCGAN